MTAIKKPILIKIKIFQIIKQIYNSEKASKGTTDCESYIPLIK